MRLLVLSVLLSVFVVAVVVSEQLDESCDTVRDALLSVSSNQSTTLARVSVDAVSFYPSMFHIPTFRQTFNYSCGPSSMLTVLWALGFPEETELSLMAEMGTDWEVGTNFSQMVDCATRRNLRVHAKQGGTIADIRQSLSEGMFVIILYQAWSDELIPYINVWDSGHFSVVFGSTVDNLLIMDPWTGQLSYLPFEYFFAQRWHAPDPYGAFGICSRCMLAVGPRADGTPNVLTASYAIPDNFIFVG